jgi:hypothetical protein
MHGLDAVGIARQAGADLATVPGPTDRIEADKLDAILRLAIPLIRDPAFGLQAARCWHPSNLGVLGHAWLSSSTLRTGLKRMSRYSRLVGERAITEIEESRQGVKVRFWAKRGNPAVVAVAAVLVDVAMALLLDMCRMNAGAALRPMAASLRRGRPENVDAYERFFGCPVRFSAEENAFVLSAKDADRSLPSSNKQLAAVFDRMLTEELARLDKSDVIARCRAAVLEDLPSGRHPRGRCEAAPHEPARCSGSSPRRRRPTSSSSTTRARTSLSLHRGPAPVDHRHHLLARLLAAERAHPRIPALDGSGAVRVPGEAGRVASGPERKVTPRVQALARKVKPASATPAIVLRCRSAGERPGTHNDNTRGSPVNYRMFRLRGSDPVDALEAHVLARAYHAAWRALNSCAPVDRLVIESLDLVIEFEPSERTPGSRGPTI